MKILDVKWFCGRKNVGIACIDEYGDGTYRYVISAVNGESEERDAQFIADYWDRSSINYTIANRALYAKERQKEWLGHAFSQYRGCRGARND